ncbi:FecR family protein [Aliirhizobium smilacinae]|uniref:FecR family protein n=2 Tax=Aliirhizobium smilacinae TaxID=1395944 RepID=A0A5C4XEG4_9HYPH|nr:FecR family protein [Rhizobium smilacinae]
MKEYETDPTYIKALEWFVRIKDKSVTSADRIAFERWIEENPSHAEAFQRAEALWKRFDIVVPEYKQLKASGRINRRSVVFGGLTLLAGGLLLYNLSRNRLFADYKTDIAERRSFTLPDGSMVELGGYSALSIEFGAGQRRILLHRGQAFFKVAADPARPFVVQAAGGNTKALGTQFDIRLSGDSAVVSVIEHAVEVQGHDASSVTVDAGWQVSYDGSGIRAATQIDIETVQAWRSNRLVFEDVPLRQVITEIERYRRGRILLADSTIGDIPITAVFDTAQMDSVLVNMAETLPVKVINARGYLAVIYRR